MRVSMYGDHSQTIAELVTRASGSDTSLAERHRAFGALVAQLQDMAFGCAFGLLGDYGRAEDAAQEAFLVAYQRLGQLRDPAAFPGWLQQIVRSQCHRVIRRSDFAVVVAWDEKSADVANAADWANGDPEQAALRSMERRQVWAALAHLPETERLVTILFYVREYSRAEVAQFLGISAVAVKKRLASARARLKERLIDMVQDDLQERRPSKDAAFTTRLMMFTKLFSAFVEEGKSLVRSLTDLSAAEDDAAFRAVIDDVNREIQAGNSLSGVMAKHPQYFSQSYVNAIRRGEQFGNVDVVLQRLTSGYYTAQPARPFTAAAIRALRSPLTRSWRRPDESMRWPHLLLGLLNDSENGATRLLVRAGADVPALHAATVAWLDANPRDAPAYAITPEIAAIEEHIDDEADRLGRERIDTVVLLVLLTESIVVSEAPFLQSVGISPGSIRAHVLASSSDDG